VFERMGGGAGRGATAEAAAAKARQRTSNLFNPVLKPPVMRARIAIVDELVVSLDIQTSGAPC